MAQTKIQGLWVRLEKRGAGFRLQIGKKVFGAIIGKSGDFSRSGLREIVTILQAGEGMVRFGDYSIAVQTDRNDTLLRIDENTVRLTPEERGRVCALVDNVLQES